MNFSTKIINWYNQNYRDLPWRNTTDAYKIWLSEIILQQTRVSQGLPYYINFINAFPTVKDLANADEQQILKLWQGLGYYSRARNLHFTAKFVVENHKGIFPNSYEELLKLKGIGTYTAAAIASFSSNEPVAVLDGNVFRVLSRVFNVDYDISQNTSKKYFIELATKVLSKSKPDIHNQAIMEFGALQCVPKSPNCMECIFNDSCEAFKLKKVSELPVKSKKVKVTKRFLNYILVKDASENYEMNKRTDNGIWKNLFEFPCIESESEIEETEILNQLNVKYEIKNFHYFDTFDVLHKLSHQHLNIKFYTIEIEDAINKGYTFEELKQLPVPIVLHNFIEKIVI
ncbi:A/G-specific adenine glycosylase [Flavobacterium sp. F372]|uniref:Adenine DNA glycosylase n=1 Tax=Flavobacterium bernardetii TaxID=2813823 RepID=A0ABR7J1A6_9FLAO|nr:A/G-specific adenine glycosylase [Flavobacterium bernardetii]MBC5835728.1 A/G-specific adenine glycosylase [Flavobacterium bernardetii]NHF69459.1 A/G-specific adenine glycosylase [Flavobacterium bernardetii]